MSVFNKNYQKLLYNIKMKNLVLLLAASSAQAIIMKHRSLLGMRDDPRCSSQGCFDNNLHYEGEEDPGHDVDYFVPNFG